MSLLDVQNLTVSTEGTTLVDNISFSLDRGQKLGIIGESGSGKTLTALAILGLLADSLSASGSVMLDGEQLLGIGEDSMCAVRGDNISMVFQEPMTALNPVMRIGRQVAEPLRLHRGLDTDDAINRAIELLDSVGIEHPERRARSYPHELSGGQRQRAMIAMALAVRTRSGNRRRTNHRTRRDRAGPGPERSAGPSARPPHRTHPDHPRSSCRCFDDRQRDRDAGRRGR